MKNNIILAIFFGLASLYAFSTNPIDPPAKIGNDVKTSVVPSTAAPLDECSVLINLVTLKINIKFTDCPDYTCEAKSCSFHICIFQGGNLVSSIPFDVLRCDYVKDVRVDDGGSVVTIMLVADPPGCQHLYNNAIQTIIVPIGGGEVNVNLAFCQ